MFNLKNNKRFIKMILFKKTNDLLDNWTQAPLFTWPPQHVRMDDKNHLLNFVVNSFGRVCPKPRDLAPPKMQVHNFIIM